MEGPLKPWFIRNLANLITILGFALCAMLLAVIIVNKEQILLIIGISLAICLTDLFDGKIARYFQTVNRFGSAIDRFRDKLFLGIIFVFLILNDQTDPTLKTFIALSATIEIFLLILWFMGVARKVDVSANVFGKIKMFLICVAVILCLLDIAANEYWKINIFALKIYLPHLIFIISLFFGIESFITHLENYSLQVYRQQSPKTDVANNL